jgi:transcriptional regulator with XRE-family HTH domain
MKPRKLPAFASRLKALREEEGLTQEELAARAGLTVQRVFKLEQGYQSDPRWSTVCKLAAGLDVSVAAFAGENLAQEDADVSHSRPTAARRRGRPREGK